MLITERMSKISVTGTKAIIEKVIKELYKLKALHIVDHNKTEKLDIGSPLERADLVSGILITMRGLINSLGINKKKKPSMQEHLAFKEKNRLISLPRVKSAVDNLHEDVLKLNEDLRNLEEKSRTMENNLKILEMLKHLNLEMKCFTETETLSYVVGIIKTGTNINISHELNAITTRYKMYKACYFKKHIIALFFEKKYRQKFLETLGKFGFEEIHMPNFDRKLCHPIDVIRYVTKELNTMAIKIRQMCKKHGKIKKGWENFLLAEEKNLTKDLEQLEAPLRFATTENVFVAEGYVPKKRVENVKKHLEKISKHKIYIKTEEIKKNDKIPTKLDNPPKVKPFEFLMHLYTLPTYKELDPTFFLFLTFPLFFGFMLGDIGYGFVTLPLFLWLRKKFEVIRPLCNILIYASIATIFFGLLFGEFFGSEVLFGFHLPHILNRLHEINHLLYISLVIGIIHINTALILGFINEYKSHGLKKAIFAKASWMVLELAAALLALSYTKKIILGPVIGYIVLLVAMAMLYAGEGVAGLTEMPSIFSNLASYVRLMALGVASASLAVVVNDFSFKLFHSGFGGIITGVLILVIGHVINIGLGILGPFLHSLRLHYVEFFTKFYKGGGKEYIPFGV